jgi:hypothetical protein
LGVCAINQGVTPSSGFFANRSKPVEIKGSPDKAILAKMFVRLNSMGLMALPAGEGCLRYIGTKGSAPCYRCDDGYVTHSPEWWSKWAAAGANWVPEDHECARCQGGEEISDNELVGGSR